MDLRANETADATREPLAAQPPTTGEPEDPRSVQLWYLRRALRALRFARYLLCEAGDACGRGAAHARVTDSLGRAHAQAQRAAARLAKDLRRLRSPRLYQWVSWQRGSEEPKGLHGEARTLGEAKAGALDAVQHLEGGGFYSPHSLASAEAFVTGPAGARYELRRAYRKNGTFRGFRWYTRGRPSRCALGGLQLASGATIDPLG